MTLSKGDKRAFEWLKTKKRDETYPRSDLLAAAKWKESSLKTYLSKNKLAPFIQPIANGRLQILMDGEEISDVYFQEVFTQSSPKRVSLRSGQVFRGSKASYELVDPLGNGAVGHVWSATVAGAADLVAIKVMLPREMFKGSVLANVRERFRREGRNGAVINHPNVVKYLDWGSVQRNPWIAMELAERSVGKKLKEEEPFTEDEAEHVIACVVEGLRALHETGSPHRDVKPDNLLEFEETYKLGDLGIVNWSDFDPSFTRGGTITRASIQLGSWNYMAPEQIQTPHEASFASDVYALGISWIEMLSGVLPSPHAIGSHSYDPPSKDESVNKLIMAMVEYEEAKRPSLDDIKGIVAK